MRKAAPFIAILVTLAVAYGFDRWLESARNIATATISVVAYQWAVLGANLVFALCILGLAWLVLDGRGQNRWPAILCFAVGLLICFLPTPPFWGLGPQVPARMAPLLMASPHSLVGHAAAFMVVIGLAGLLIPVPQKDTDPAKPVSQPDLLP